MGRFLIAGATGLIGKALAARAGDGARPPPALPQTGRSCSGTHLAAHLVRRAGQIDAALPCGHCLLLPWHHPQGCRLGRGISPGRSRLCAGLCRARPSPRLPPPAGGLQSGRQPGFPCPLSPHQGRDGAGPAGPGWQRLVILRPAMLLGHREPARRSEQIIQAIYPLVKPLLRGSLRRWRAIEASQVAHAMARLAIQESGIETVENERLLTL